MKKVITKLICTCMAIGGFFSTYGQTIVTTKHNLSVTGPGAVKASSESEICKFCHTPHNSSPQAPLWNRSSSGVTYTLYSSSTLNAIPGQPDGSSMLCLSCHDGTVALGNIVNGPAVSFASGVTVMPAGKKNLSTDLSNDHPISFLYDAALASTDGQLVNPSGITPPVDLEKSKMQCTSCHDPHKNLFSNFLVTTSQTSALCLSCHTRTYWSASSHKTSTKTWNGAAPNPWFFTPYTTVADNACENCHNPHNAGGKIRLLKYVQEENNCLDCHNGNVASSAKNIQTEILKPNRHDVYSYTGIHDPTENKSVSVKHVECVDCHNPHAANNTTATAPAANGFLKGVSGIDQSGIAVSTVTNAYEVCYKCHAGNSWAPLSATPRMVVQNNVRLEFATTNASFHPVVGPRNNPDVLSLISPLTQSSVIYCTSCHGSDNTAGPSGPHGSIYPQILKLQYVRTASSNYSTASYALCFSCHSSTKILSDNSTFRKHKEHIVDRQTSCNTCHDPHGSTNTNLINFNTAVVRPNDKGVLSFNDMGDRRGECSLTCHGEDHDRKGYN
jgi:predicted CXXCH cytochrome family protein